MSPWAGPQQRSAETREAKREGVIRAAARAFASSGIDGTSMDDIAAALSVAKPTLYRAVGGKEAIVHACEERMNACFMSALHQAEAAGGTGLARALRYLRLSLDLIDHNDFGRLVLVIGGKADLFAAMSEETRAMREQVQSKIRGWLAVDLKAGLLRPSVEPKVATLAMFAVFNFIPRWYRAGGPSTLAEICDSNTRLFVWALTDQPQAHGLEL